MSNNGALDHIYVTSIQPWAPGKFDAISHSYEWCQFFQLLCHVCCQVLTDSAPQITWCHKDYEWSYQYIMSRWVCECYFCLKKCFKGAVIVLFLCPKNNCTTTKLFEIKYLLDNGARHLVAITGTTILVPCDQELITTGVRSTCSWCSETSATIFFLNQAPSSRGSSYRVAVTWLKDTEGTRIVVPVIEARATLYDMPMA